METGDQSTSEEVKAMQTRRRHSFHRIMFALGIALPGLIGILVAHAESATGEAGMFRPAAQAQGTSTATLTAAPLLTATPPLQTSTESPSPPSLPTSVNVLPSGLYAFIEAPIGPVPEPFVILSAFSSLPTQVSIVIRGFVNLQEFICTASPCAISLQTSSRLVFAAYAETGETSETVIATVSVTQTDNGFLVTIDSVSQFRTFTNSCGVTWGVFDELNVAWDDFVQFPYELHTKKTLHNLATQLILNGIVDASDCPVGGLSLGLSWPTACGLERSMSAMIEWQNQYDDHIWLASSNHGVPPKILKTLIEVETQFWPGNVRVFLDEYGLGQVNQLGVDVLLRRDPTLYQRVCPSVLSDCLRPYLSLDPQQQAMIRGAVVRVMDVTCAECEYGFDLNKAKESIAFIALLLRANCQQVDFILNNVDLPDLDADVATATAAVATIAAGGDIDTTSYEDLWRFTLLSYHSGLSCFQEALISTRKANQPLTWENVSERINCRGGAGYVDAFMNNLFAFDFYRLDYTDTGVVIAAPTIIPTRTPIPTPTVFISNATVRVQVFMDRNGNGTPEADEWIDAMTVLLETSTNERITQRTQNGIAIFDMTGYTPGIEINVSLPGLYRNERFELPEEGEVTVTFIFELPPLPTSIP
jgi:hypothetical protein